VENQLAVVVMTSPSDNACMWRKMSRRDEFHQIHIPRSPKTDLCWMCRFTWKMTVKMMYGMHVLLTPLVYQLSTLHSGCV